MARTKEDTRLRHSPASAVRGSRSTEDESRTLDQGTALDKDELRQLLRSEFQAEALPTVPDIPGWHTCWLSTTSTSDPIYKRQRLGYVPVHPDELPGFDSSKMRSGEYGGCISCNEMLLFKVPMDRYLAIMEEFHHNQPRDEEANIHAQILAQQRKDGAGKPLLQVEDEGEEGFNQLVQNRKPMFV